MGPKTSDNEGRPRFRKKQNRGIRSRPENPEDHQQTLIFFSRIQKWQRNRSTKKTRITVRGGAASQLLRLAGPRAQLSTGKGGKAYLPGIYNFSKKTGELIRHAFTPEPLAMGWERMSFAGGAGVFGGLANPKKTKPPRRERKKGSGRGKKKRPLAH